MLANDGMYELMESNGIPTPLAMGTEIATASLAQLCLAAPAQHQLSGVKTLTYNRLKGEQRHDCRHFLLNSCSVSPLPDTGVIPANGFCRGMAGMCGGCFCC